MTEEIMHQMLKEYQKDGKFAEFVNKSNYAYGTTVGEELEKATVYEYYKSVTEGANKE